MVAVPVLQAPAAQALSGWPTFTHRGVPFRREDLAYNPTDELIFPCIRLVAGRAADPLGRWYLYYSPHNAPGGICMAYGNSLGGPFTEYSANPVVARTWAPHHSVSHVASPHVLWNEANRTFYLYYHGENTTTRLARSADGLNWTYDRAILTTADLPENVTETSYARAFRHAIPGRGNTYIMLFMGNQAGTRKIFLAWSGDQRRWTVQQTPLVSPAGDGATQIANPTFALKNGIPHVIYNSVDAIHVTRVGTDFDQEVHLGVMYEPTTAAPDLGRAAAPSFAQENGVVHMFYEAGARLHGRIARATAAAIPGLSFRT
ncbi:twin-arginine translocation signal domain-containing protein [Kineococcus glutinatus]|uniref:Twin-arginine translocation signal domain-containing protein n=1 Tax=Kineococcus glutinatus TaxID=1070872 RepID=A0ABP9H2K9_9ACTN